jgi:hypothetical protein
MTDYFFNFKKNLHESEEDLKLPGGWKVLPIGSDHKVSTSGQPTGYGIFMTDPKDIFYFDFGDKRDTEESFPTEQAAYDGFMKDYNTPGTDYYVWKKQQK